MTQIDSPDKPQLPCPTCKAAVIWSEDNPFRPFCSKRCQLIDLGDWAEENYRITGEPDLDGASSDQLEEH